MPNRTFKLTHLIANLALAVLSNIASAQTFTDKVANFAPIAALRRVEVGDEKHLKKSTSDSLRYQINWRVIRIVNMN